MQICRIKGCGGKRIARGLCFPHYRQLLRKGHLPLCKIEGCKELAMRGGWCHSHYKEFLYEKAHPKENLQTPPVIEFDGNIYHIWLYNHKREKIAECLLDQESYERVKQYRMYAQHWNHPRCKPYIQCMIGQKYIPIHRFLLNPPPGMEVDHINGNTYDNRKENLRICTRAQNAMNKQGVKGYYLESKNKWRAYLYSGGKMLYSECFKTEEEAREGRLHAEDQFFGEWKYREEPVPEI